MQLFKLYNICVTIVRSYTRKYHEFVAICIVTCANGKKQVIFFVVQFGTMVIMILSNETSVSLHVQTQCGRIPVPDLDSHVTCSTDTDSK